MTPALLPIFNIFLRIGNTTFGGGDPTILALRRELVERKGWDNESGFGAAYVVARFTPGTNMLAFCAAAAWRLGGWPAAVLAVAAVTIPSGVLSVALTAGFEAVQGNRPAMAAVSGTVAAAVGMMSAGAWMLARPHFSRAWLWPAAVLAASAAAGVVAPPLYVLLGAALAGFALKTEA
jgi:chromate transporter